MNAATQIQVTFKSYSEKSKAKRALKQVYGVELDQTIEVFLTQVDGKWGFYLKDNTPFVHTVEAQDEQVSNETSVDSEDNKAAAAFGAFALGQLGGEADKHVNTVAPRAETTLRGVHGDKGTGRGIEKNRPEQNGVTRPSIGGLCRAVWDACDALRTEHGTVTAKMVKAHAETQGWNPNNASIEFYQWRKFNGITGRSKKAE